MVERGSQGPSLTLYASLLRAALEQDLDQEDVALAADIATLVRKRAEMLAAVGGSPPGPAPVRARATMAYDAALVRLCQRLDIDHLFFSGPSPDAARASAEADLARRMPALSADLLGETESVADQPPTAAKGPEQGE